MTGLSLLGLTVAMVVAVSLYYKSRLAEELNARCAAFVEVNNEHERRNGDNRAAQHPEVGRSAQVVIPPVLENAFAFYLIPRHSYPVDLGASLTPETSVEVPEGMRLAAVAEHYASDRHIRDLLGASHLRLVDLRSTTRVSSEGLAVLADHPSLRSLWLGVTDHHPGGREGMAECRWPALRDLKQITELEIHASNPTPDTLDAVFALANLVSLNIGLAQARHDHYPNGFRRFAQLQVLRVGLETDSDRWLDAVCALPTLEELDFVGFNLTDWGMRNLSRLTQLRKLRIKFAPNLTDAALSELRALSELKELALVALDGISNYALEWLPAAPLDQLTLDRCRGVSDVGLAAALAEHRIGKLVVCRQPNVTGSFLADVSAVGSGLHTIEFVECMSLNGRNFEKLNAWSSGLSLDFARCQVEDWDLVVRLVEQNAHIEVAWR